ncbi:hypothetical protein [Brevibacterium sp. UCMA 11754]|uniref:hypothetical protein n=1 Tax=Brevibacterium sp. UCMA 11754 TaxID=2749198 RepID=UPI001F479CFB|nr:hypothetical protein [Brevibacterium sp. UCMA 11754]
MSKNQRRQRAAKRIKDGNGRALKPFRWWQMLSRALFYLPREVEGEPGPGHVYAVDVVLSDSLAAHWTASSEGG